MNIIRSILAFYLFFLSLPLCIGETSDKNEKTVNSKGPEVDGLLREWQFTPHYQLPWPEGALGPDYDEDFSIEPEQMGIRLAGQSPSHRINADLSNMDLPQYPFSIEMWVSYHVNQPVGAAVMSRDFHSIGKPHWLFGFYKGEVFVHTGGVTHTIPAMKIKSSNLLVDYEFPETAYNSGEHRYWHHLVANFDVDYAELFHNGISRKRIKIESPMQQYADTSGIEFSGYFDHEPHMELANLLKYAALYDKVLSQEEIVSLFKGHKELLDAGVLYRNKLHFTTTAPHLAMPTTDSIHITWETDRPVQAELHWGKTMSLGEVILLENNGKRNRKVKLNGLNANSTYYYKVIAEAGGEKVDSGIRPFRTAVEDGDPVVFAAISDTEARPHVNAKLAELIWRETPHLLLNAGDLTDGGRQDNRVEWTHEYFAAMGHLMSRLPFLPVMGNGEDDFVWFQRYHYTPGDAVSYYNYRYGDIEFFILDSNLGKRSREHPGFREAQVSWLEKALQNSTAKWKIASHHHPALPESYPLIISDFVEYYERFNVDVVIVGHHHNYKRSWPLRMNKPVSENGVVYLQLGGGGGNLSPRPRTPDLRWEKTYQGYGFSMFWIHGNILKYAMYDDKGSMRDYLILDKN